MGEEKEKFEVNSLSSADWALRKIKELEADIKQNMDFAESEKIRLEQWLESENHKYQESIEYFNGLLSHYLQELRKDNPKAKISTPHGTVSTRKNPKQWTYSDDVLAELEEKEMFEFIRIKKEVDKKELKKVLCATDDGIVVNSDGEVIKGVTVVDCGEVMTIKIAE